MASAQWLQVMRLQPHSIPPALTDPGVPEAVSPLGESYCPAHHMVAKFPLKRHRLPAVFQPLYPEDLSLCSIAAPPLVSFSCHSGTVHTNLPTLAHSPQARFAAFCMLFDGRSGPAKSEGIKVSAEGVGISMSWNNSIKSTFLKPKGSMRKKCER